MGLANKAAFSEFLSETPGTSLSVEEYSSAGAIDGLNYETVQLNRRSRRISPSYLAICTQELVNL
jgi:hypothetical protein